MHTRIFQIWEALSLSISGWMFAFFCIVFVRTFLENFSAQRPGMLFTTDVATILHYGLFYAVTLLAITAVVQASTSRSMRSVAAVTLCGFMIVLTPPLIDLILTQGHGAPMAYLFGTSSELVRNYVTWFASSPSPGITDGIRTELMVVVGAVLAYVRYAGRSWVRALCTALLVYTTLFVCVSLPNYLPITHHAGWLFEMQESVLGNTAFRDDVAFTSVGRAYDMHFNIALAQVWYLLLVPLIVYVLFRSVPQKVVAVLRNSRPERVLHFVCMLLVGGALAYHTPYGLGDLSGFFTGTTLIVLVLAYYFAWMFAVATNDIVDRDSDAITNSSRPLITGVLTEADMRDVARVSLVLALIGGFLAGHIALFLVLVFIATYSLYSCPPLRLKQFVIINSFFVALASLTVILAGFFTVSTRQDIAAFPIVWACGITVVLTLLANIKDLKDTAGDRAVGVYTIPVLFGDRIGRRVVWGLVALALMLIPVYAGDVRLFLPGSIAALIAYPLMHRTPFQERYLFLLWFLYLGWVWVIVF